MQSRVRTLSQRAKACRCLICLGLAAGVLAGCGGGSPRVTATPEEARAIAEEAYIFSFPMLMGYRFGFAQFLVPSLPTYRGPVNAIHGKPVTLDHTFKDVITPNADTPYSMGLLDLRAEPVVLQVPEVTNRYYVMQFEDLYGTNPHYVGTRATGSKAGTYLVAGPRWDGEVGDGFDDVLRFETDDARATAESPYEEGGSYEDLRCRSARARLGTGTHRRSPETG